MSAVLKPEDREAMRRIANRAKQIVERRVRWEFKIMSEIGEGYSTREEIAALVRARFTQEDMRAVNDAIRRLIAKGLIRERPMIEQAGRAVRINPVTVFERVS